MGTICELRSVLLGFLMLRQLADLAPVQRWLVAAVLLLALPHSATGQQPQAEPTANGADALRIFLDCDSCDFDFLRREITYVNYVRNREDAQVHVLVTSEGTGGGGRAYTIDFVGLDEFSGTDDQLSYFSTQDETDDDIRHGLARTLQLGLVRYAAETPLADQLTVTYRRPVGSAPTSAAQPEDDPWNFWVFRTRFNTRLEAEESETSKSFGGSFSGNRITDNWKINLGVNVSYNEDVFELSDGGEFINVRRNNSITARFIKSVSEHVGVGFGGSAVTSTFRNQDLSLHVAPAIQYNFYPYSESTRRQLTLTYSLGYSAFDYEEPTIFDKASERRPSHNAIFSLDMNEPWGESAVTFEYSQFLDDRSKYRGVVFGRLDVRLFRGFSLDVRGDTSLVRDQIFLPRGGVTDQEILVRRRQLATDYEYSIRIGITYSFGSIYNNIVNSRFAGSSGGFIRSF